MSPIIRATQVRLIVARTGSEVRMTDRHATVTTGKENAAPSGTAVVNPLNPGLSMSNESARGRNRTYNLVHQSPAPNSGESDFSLSDAQDNPADPTRQGAETPHSDRHGTVIHRAAVILDALADDRRRTRSVIAGLREDAAALRALDKDLPELRAALSGRTVSCVCGGDELERLRADAARLDVLETMRCGATVYGTGTVHVHLKLPAGIALNQPLRGMADDAARLSPPDAAWLVRGPRAGGAA